MLQGKVKFFNEAKGFGFITPSVIGRDVFVHTSGLVDNIRKNDVVTFDTPNGNTGVNEVNVKLAYFK